MSVVLIRFSGYGEHYDEYLRVRYKVFVEEEGWLLDADPKGGRCAEDPADQCSRFVLARSASPGNATIGIVRSTVTSRAFPHRELFADHLSRAPLSRLSPDTIATVNSLAVVPAFRRRPVTVAGHREPVTTARALLIDMVNWLRSEGVLLIVASAVPIASARLFGGIGFAALDPFQKYEQGRAVLNMGLVIKGSPHGEAADKHGLIDEEVSAYLTARHAAATAGRGLAQYIDEWVASRQPV
jgi:N-acyl-L-homoserine lactone synthetase